MSSIRTSLRGHIGWVATVILCALPLLRCFWINDLGLVTQSWFGLASAIGKLSALAGTVLFAINFVLATRDRWLERAFGGMNGVYVTHHITGGLALILLCLHPTFIALRYIRIGVSASYQTAAQVLLPDSVNLESMTKFLGSMAVNFGSIAFFGLVVLMILTLFVKLGYQTWLFSHRFMGAAFALAGLHVLLVPSDVSRDNWLKIYFMVIIAVGIVAYIRRVMLPRVAVRRYSYRVMELEQLTDMAFSLRLEPAQEPLHFEPGQFIFITLHSKGLAEESHPFTIASTPSVDGTIEIVVKLLGDYTTQMRQSIKKGDMAEIEGAYGRFVSARYGRRRQVWIAGGIGVTPFLSMLGALHEKSPAVDLFYSVANPGELIRESELQRIARQQKGFAYHPYIYSREKKYLSAAHIKKTLGSLDNKTYFICGPTAMIHTIRDQLKSEGVPARSIITEEFSLG